MKLRNVVTGQAVSRQMAGRARELRREITPAEKALWQALRRNQLDGCHFRRQQVIGGCIVDFYCHAAGLVIEVDGPVHAGQQGQDRERDEVLAQRGLHVLHITNDDVLEQLERTLERVRSVLVGLAAENQDLSEL